MSSSRPPSTTFGYAFSPSLIAVEETDKPQRAASKRGSRRRSRLSKSRISGTYAPNQTPSGPVSATSTRSRPSSNAFLSRLSFGATSPLFSLDAVPHDDDDNKHQSLPTSAFEDDLADLTPPPPKLDYSSSPASTPSSPQPSLGRTPLLSMSKSIMQNPPELPHSAKSIDSDPDGTAMIDRQLEMLSQLFPGRSIAEPEPVPMASPPVATSEAQTPPRSIEAELDLDASSDYQPETTGQGPAHQPIQEWPAVAQTHKEERDMSKEEVPSSNTTCSTSGLTLLEAYSGHPEAPSDDHSTSKPDRSSTRISSESSRKQHRPQMSIDTAGTHEFASRELKLIRRLKDESALQAGQTDAEVPILKDAPPTSKPLVQAPPPLTAPVSAVIQRHSIAFTPLASSRIDVTEDGTFTTNPGRPNLHRTASKSGHARRASVDSAISGIVWSAVVKHFSEMAQEIAGPKIQPLAEENEAGFDGSGTGPRLSTVDDKPLHLSTNRISTHSGRISKTYSITSIQALKIIKGQTFSEAMPSTESSNKSSKQQSSSSSASSSSVSNTPPQLTSPLNVSNRSRASVELASLLVQLGSGKEPKQDVSVGKEALPLTAPARPELPLPQAPRSHRYSRVRVVRIISHHEDLDDSANKNVEGDYAKFLRRSSMHPGKVADDAEDDDSSPPTPKSTKSGIENGLYRRGSMRSIHSGLTIATVGGVSIKDMSRGARYRRPSPFFSNNHAWKKPHGPHQDPAVARKKSNKANKTKRNSADAEPLHITLTRLREEKRNAPPVLIGELSFENDKPVKAATSLPSLPRKGSLPSLPTLSQTPKASKSGYAATSIGLTSKTETDNRNLLKHGHAASSIGSYKPAHAHSASGSVVGLATAAALQRQHNRNNSVTHQSSRSMLSQSRPRPSYAASEIVPSRKVQTGNASTLPMLSAARNQIINSSSSNVSVGGASIVKSPPKNPWSVPGPGAHSLTSPPNRSRNAARSAPDTGLPSSVPMEDSFLSMTPSRSEISVASSTRERNDPNAPARSAPQTLDRRGSRSTVRRQSSVHNPSTPASLASEQPRAASGRARSSTNPLPQVPASLPDLPLRNLPASQQSSALDNTGRMSSHRAQVPLSIDTELAKKNLKKQQERAAAQAAAQQQARQPSMDSVERRRSVKNVRKPSKSEGRDHEEPHGASRCNEPEALAEDPMTAHTTRSAYRPPSAASSERSTVFVVPKSAGAAFANVFSAPKRPQRKDSQSPTIPIRYPRPQSVSPVRPENGEREEISAFYESKDNTTRSNSTGKAISKFLGFGKKSKK